MTQPYSTQTYMCLSSLLRVCSHYTKRECNTHFFMFAIIRYEFLVEKVNNQSLLPLIGKVSGKKDRLAIVVTARSGGVALKSRDFGVITYINEHGFKRNTPTQFSLSLSMTCLYPCFSDGVKKN